MYLAIKNYVLKAAKNVPRIGRSNTNKNTNIDEMGKFFMKASKSVPRIGRRNENFDYGQPIVKRDEVPIWSDIADRFEYDPEILTSPEILEQLEMGDDPSVYEWEKIRTKRDSHKPHPKFYYVM
ncbi:ecdysis triggering hormone [Tribolium castaneum]|uniref:Ecdysis triggering hormone n=1 Tax=Tribolium castaneum TaxID=7070 RepID=D6WRE3_TRICA|nr:ecdysis triggering hormone [Tribolium castaneum]